MIKLRQIDEYRWEIPREGKMRTRGLIFCSKEMLPVLQADQSLQQVANVATLPGIVGPSLAMPDIHWGYGFAIGRVAAFKLEGDRLPARGSTSTAGCACSARG